MEGEKQKQKQKSTWNLNTFFVVGVLLNSQMGIVVPYRMIIWEQNRDKVDEKQFFRDFLFFIFSNWK